MPAGRKKKYNKKTFAKLAEELASEGLADYQIWEQLDISHDTFYRYINEFKEFSDALKRGRKVILHKIENALVKRALGYEYEEEQKVVKVDKEGTATPIEVKKIKKHIAPDVGAIIFYTTNRDPEKWQNKINQKTEIDLGDSAVVILPSNGHESEPEPKKDN